MQHAHTVTRTHTLKGNTLWQWIAGWAYYIMLQRSLFNVFGGPYKLFGKFKSAIKIQNIYYKLSIFLHGHYTIHIHHLYVTMYHRPDKYFQDLFTSRIQVK